MHTEVVIPLHHGGEARCPYCGTLYKFKVNCRGRITNSMYAPVREALHRVRFARHGA